MFNLKNKKILGLLIFIFVFTILGIILVMGGNLPTPGGDTDTWGTILNNYLQIEHDTSGSHTNITATEINLTGNLIVNTSDLFVDASLGNVGIGTTSPDYPLDIAHTTTITSGDAKGSNILLTANPTDTSTGSYYGLFSMSQFNGDYPLQSGSYVHGIFSVGRHNGINTSANVIGVWGRSENFNNGTIDDSYGVVGQSRNSESGNITIAIGTVGAVRNQLAGTITNAYGVYGDLLNPGTGNISNAYNFYATDPTNSGTITNLYGIYIVDQTSGTNHWAIYQAGSDDNSYFAGNISIGTTSPTHKLNVIGTGNFSIGDAPALILDANTTAVTCDSSTAGGIIYSENKHWGCDGSNWNAFY